MGTLDGFLGPFTWKTISSPLLWGNVCLYFWDGFFIYSRMLDLSPPSISVSLCVFIGGLCPLILRNINDEWLLMTVILMLVVLVHMSVFLCDFLIITYFVYFIELWYPRWVRVFLLVFFVGLVLWIDIV